MSSRGTSGHSYVDVVDEEYEEFDVEIDDEEASNDEEPKEKLNYAPAGTITEVRNVYEGEPDKHGKTTWTLKFPKDLEEPVENEESAQFALLIRNKKCYDGRSNLRIHSLVVQSKPLREVLGEVLKGYPGVSSTSLNRLEFSPPFQPFVHRWEAFEKAIEEEQDPENKKHLDLLHEVLHKELADTIAEKNDLFKNGVARYDDIWTLFEPNSLVFSTSNEGEHERVYRFASGYFGDSQQDGPHYALSCEYVDWDGDKFGTGYKELKIRKFGGTVPITKLPIFPFDFCPRKDEVKARLIRRGKLFESYQGYHFKHYEGVALGRNQWGCITRYTISSRVIIDTFAFGRFVPNERLHLSKLKPAVSVEFSRESDGGETDYSDSEDDEMTDVNALNGLEKIKQELSEEQRLIATHELRGYSLKDKKWLILSIPCISEIKWNDDAFKCLVAPEEQKELILAFARSQMKHRDNFDDVISGKGKGIIMLLSGPPGVGKTLTAESVAETMKVPLYTMSAGDLGTSPTEVEQKLSNILEMNTKWNAVLLLDEADVFLQARDSRDLERNKLVSIFLRLLEYYEGILFMTTNRVDDLDAAFESRIHLSLQYHDLDKASRAHVWKTFLSRAAGGEGGSRPGFTEEQIDELAEHRMNGRQIKNVLKSSQLLASERGTQLAFSDVHTVLRIRKANQHGTGAFGGQ